MREDRGQYLTNSSEPQTAEAFRNHPCTLPFADGYQPPSASTVTAFIQMTGWQHKKIAGITGVVYTHEKGSPTVRRWKSKGKEFRQIPYSAWRLLLLAAGVVEISEDLNAVDTNKVTN